MIRQLRLPVLALALCAGGTARADSVTKVIDNGPDGTKRVIAVLGDGYAVADQAKFDGDVDRLIVNGVFGHDFFQENQNAFNVYRVNLISVDSGVTRKVYDEHGTPADASDDTVKSITPKNSALKYVFSGSWAHCWLEESPTTPALRNAALAKWVPHYDYVVVILNDDSYGGCGGGGLQVVPRGVDWPVLAHEYGHGIGGLADEYSAGGKGKYPGAAINNNNISTVGDRSKVYWNRFVDPATPAPTAPGTGDPNRTTGLFVGGGTWESGIFHPVDSCRMKGNTPPFCPVCSTIMSKALYPYTQHTFDKVYAGDFDGDGRSDLLVHNGQDLAAYRTKGTKPAPSGGAGSGGAGLDLTWVANNVVPAGPGGNIWQPAPGDQYVVADFDGDGKDDLVVFNGADWNTPYLGLLHSTGTGFQCVARYDGAVPGFWTFKPGDKILVGDFDGDGKADVALFNGANWSAPYLGVLRSTGTHLAGVHRYDGTVPGWAMKPGDQFTVADFDGDGKSDLYVFNGTNWGVKYFGMLKSSGSGLSDAKLFSGSLPGWTLNTHDQFFVGGGKKSDLYVFNGSDWAHAYLLMVQPTGTDLAFVKRYDDGTAAANVPGWHLTKGDRLYPADANKDGKTDLFVYNTTNWGTDYLGTLLSTGSGLTGSWAAHWVGGWNLGPGDVILPCHYDGPGGVSDVVIRNKQWLGLISRKPSGFAMDRIYFRRLATPLYDTRPWSDSLP
ncbi:MAG: hypothetical protein JWO38_939 [Gemmataceae bacterium]|nr:hypothetical protein [Gemmataceae bacterium]